MIIAILTITVFFRGIPIRNPSILTLQPSNVDYPQWELPQGAKARLGKGKTNDIKFSPDGTQFAVATTIGVWMYDAKTGKEKAFFKGERQDFKSIAYTSDGKYLTGASYAGEISRWNADTGELLGTIENEQDDYFRSAFFSEDGTKFASTSLIRKGDDILGNVHVWHLGENTTDTQTVTNIDLDIKEEDIRRIALSPDSHFLATTIDEKNFESTIHVSNADTGALLLTMGETKQRLIRSLAFSPDGTILASADSNSIHLWDMDSAISLATFKATAGFHTLVFSPNSKLIASGNDDGSVTLWNTTVKQQGLGGIFSKYTPTLELKGHKDEVSALAFSPDGKQILSGSEDGTIRAWDITTGRNQFTCSGHIDEISGIAATEKRDTIISVVSSQSHIQHWNIETGHQSSVSFFNRFVSSETISPNATTLVMKDFLGKNIRLLDISENRYRVNINGHRYSKKAYSFVFEFSPDEKMLAITSDDDQVGVIQLWDITNPSHTNRPLYILNEHKGEVETLKFSPNGKILASGGDGDEINLWNVETGNHIFTLTGHKNDTMALAFSPNGKILASASYSAIYLWDLTTRMQLRKCKTAGGNNELKFSPDGKTIVVGKWKGIFQLFDTQTCHLLSTHNGHTHWNQITDLVFLKDGKTLASASSDGTIILWDWEKISQVNP